MRPGLLCLAVLLPLIQMTAAQAQEMREVAFFGFELINSSLEPTSAEETARIEMLDGLFREKLAASGKYAIVELPAATLEKLAAGPEIRNCNGCDLDAAREAGADLSAWGTVQKVSNLILSINLQIREVSTGRLVRAGTVSIRGNTDESWSRGLLFLLKRRIFND